MEGCLSSVHFSGRETGDVTLVGSPWLWDSPVCVDPGGHIPHAPQLRSGNTELSRSPQTSLHASPANPGSAPGAATAEASAPWTAALRPTPPPPGPGSPALGGVPPASGDPHRPRGPAVLGFPTSHPGCCLYSLPRAPDTLAQQIPTMPVSSTFSRAERPSVRPRPKWDGTRTDSLSTRYRGRCVRAGLPSQLQLVPCSCCPSAPARTEAQGEEQSAADAIRAHPML